MAKLTLVAAVLAVVIIQCFCAINPIRYSRMDGRIIGGHDIDIMDAPYMVSLRNQRWRTRCAGSIIHPRWVLTAAICTDNMRITDVLARAGSTQPNVNGTVLDVARIILHPKYHQLKQDFDFSLIELSVDITFDETMQPIGLPEQDEEYPDETLAFVSGWGETESDLAFSLKAVTVPLINQDICTHYYDDNAFTEITDNMICAGYLKDGGKDNCLSDHGAPLVIDGMAIGLASWGRGCMEPGAPGVYSRVTSAISWIKSTTGI